MNPSKCEPKTQAYPTHHYGKPTRDASHVVTGQDEVKTTVNEMEYQLSEYVDGLTDAQFKALVATYKKVEPEFYVKFYSSRGGSMWQATDRANWAEFEQGTATAAIAPANRSVPLVGFEPSDKRDELKKQLIAYGREFFHRFHADYDVDTRDTIRKVDFKFMEPQLPYAWCPAR